MERETGRSNRSLTNSTTVRWVSTARRLSRKRFPRRRKFWPAVCSGKEESFIVVVQDNNNKNIYINKKAKLARYIEITDLDDNRVTFVCRVNFKKNEKNYNAENSEVFKMVQEADKEPKTPEPG